MRHSEDDGLTMKFVVAAVWIFETLHVLFVGHMLNYYLIVNYGVPSSLEYIVWSFPASVLANTFVLVIVQCFFTRKIYYLCRRQLRWLVIAPIILLVLIRIGKFFNYTRRGFLMIFQQGLALVCGLLSPRETYSNQETETIVLLYFRPSCHLHQNTDLRI
ncbi:hypothetical protein PISMIDRAFT_409193 [Pisolithus microcarpus 441]|uniref:Uncharacterized protein n=1 Tax=Pisolithus microcarpus 441 TaxID=765257 RepID=A0A0C9Z5L4_9AGAM|nr:hypothetical protein BKA83DRAFT_409193 [Pisolithus microcarpus]KIK24406.1 hypothetical protein PISMIDRAFT_409193 [Pisolithus microcarpus 441]